MKMLKKSLSLMLCLVILLSCVSLFSSCNKNEQDEEGEEKVITVGDLKQYSVIRSKNVSEGLNEKISEFYFSLRNKFSYAFYLKDDDMENDADAPEIVIGNCERDECDEFYADMRSEDYGYTVVGNKLIIGGGSDSATIKAMETFTENIIDTCDKDSDSVFFDSNSDSFFSKANYNIEAVKLNGTDIKEYSVVYEVGGIYDEKSAAQALSDGISEKCGFSLEVVKDSSAIDGKRICMGVTVANKSYTDGIDLGESNYFIGQNGDSIIILASSAYGYVCAAKAFVEKTDAQNGSNAIDIIVEDGILAAYQSAELSAMTFNIRGNTRLTQIIQIIDKYRPDTVGLQEDKLYGLQQIKARLGDVYEQVAINMSVSQNEGEYCSILYNKNKLSVVESGTKWMSPTPDVPYSEFECPVEVENPNELRPRIFTYAVFERKSDGFRYMHVNTHLSHVCNEMRVLQIEVLANFLDNYKEIPVIVTGDFNSESTMRPYFIMTSHDFSDSQQLAKITKNTGKTYLGDVVTPVTFNKVIDFCFMRDVKYVRYYSVITDTINDEYPSDHMPVYVEFELF